MSHGCSCCRPIPCPSLPHPSSRKITRGWIFEKKIDRKSGARRVISSTSPFTSSLSSYLLVLPLAHQLHLPGCGGQIPCALSLMRTLAPLPRTTLSQVMSPATCRRRADRSEGEGLSSSLSSSVSHDGTGRPVVGSTFDSQVSSVQETQRHSSESEQISTLLDRQSEQILADCQAENTKTRIVGRLRWKKYSKNEWNDRVTKKRNLSCSSRIRTTSTRSTTSS